FHVLARRAEVGVWASLPVSARLDVRDRDHRHQSLAHLRHDPDQRDRDHHPAAERTDLLAGARDYRGPRATIEPATPGNRDDSGGHRFRVFERRRVLTGLGCAGGSGHAAVLANLARDGPQHDAASVAIDGYVGPDDLRGARTGHAADSHSTCDTA